MTAWILTICMGNIGAANLCAYERQVAFISSDRCYEGLRNMRFSGDTTKIVLIAHCHEGKK